MAGVQETTQPRQVDEKSLTLSGNEISIKNSDDLAQGDVFYVNASGETENLSAGTSGQTLQTQGADANPIWSSPTGGNFGGCLDATVPAGATNYHCINGISSAESEIQRREIIIPKNGSLRNLRTNVGVNSLSSTLQVNVFVNGASTDLSIQYETTQTGAKADTESVSVSAGDRVAIQIVTNSGTGTADRVRWGVEYRA